MTSRRLAPAELPGWPRNMARDLAAAYVGVSPNVFDSEVASGVWPKGRPRGARGGLLTWDKELLDAAANREAGLTVLTIPDQGERVTDQEIKDRLHRAQATRRNPKARQKDAA
jgi:hypothetical protein